MIWNLINSIIAFGALFIAWKSYKRNISLEEKHEKETLKFQQKALLTHWYEKNPSPTVSKLHIVNEGVSKARNVRIFIDDKPIIEWEFCVKEDYNFTEIPPTNEVTIRVIEVEQMKSRWDIKINWEDDSDEKGDYVGIIELF